VSTSPVLAALKHLEPSSQDVILRLGEGGGGGGGGGGVGGGGGGRGVGVGDGHLRHRVGGCGLHGGVVALRG